MNENSHTNPLERVRTITFDIFGTVLNLAGSLVPPLEKLLRSCNAPESITGADVWSQWRQRQRIEQYQDNLLMLGHSGYLAVKKKALLYSLRTFKIEFTYEQIDKFMKVYQDLTPFQDAIDGLKRLGTKYDLVILSNGEELYLHPSVYRFAAKRLEQEPDQIMMVASHSFDILGARHSGFRGAYVNRYDLPYDESEYRPDLTTENFDELCLKLKV